MKLLLIAFTVIGLSAFGYAEDTWTDGNGVVWSMFHEVRTTHARADERCKTRGLTLPTVDDLLEAFEMGLANPEVNTVFGAKAAKIDWAWTRTSQAAPSPFFYIVSRWSDSTPVPATERHFVLCAG